MPKANYTAAKGLFESNDSGSGFSISGAGLYMQNQSVSLSIPKYTLDLSACPATTKDQGTDGNTTDDRTTKYSGSILTLVNGAGTTIQVDFASNLAGGNLFASNNTGSVPAADGSTIPAADGGGDVTVTVNEGEGPSDIAGDLVTAINSAQATIGLFAVDEGGSVVSIYVGATGQVQDKTTTLAQSETSILPDVNDASSATLVIGDEGAISRTAGYLNTDRGNNKTLGTTNAVHYSGWSEVDVADDIASLVITSPLKAGIQAGHEKFIRYVATNADLKLTGTFVSADGSTVTSGTSLTIPGGSNHFVWLIWNGASWLIANASDTTNGTIVVAA